MLRNFRRKKGLCCVQQAQRRLVHGFTTQEARIVPELQLKATVLRHDRTGLEHLHIERNDPHNVFSIGFATPPTDKTGVPHILEHVTLCGSEKYPVRDPFFKMLNRSLATYMNAFTASDHTYYPFSTINQVDLSNLRDVYLDATLSPRLRKLDFLQEGWRLEHQDPQDSRTPIELKGVVYNEMKGQMSDASYLFHIMFQREMHMGTVYAHDSGGDPRHIPELSHEQLVAFHSRYYHPSNAKVFTYGSFPLENHLQCLDDKLKPFTPGTRVRYEKTAASWKGPRSVVLSGPFDPLTPSDAQIKTSTSFLCNDISDKSETFSMKILSSLLLDGHGAPLYKGLIEHGLGTDFSPNTGYDSSTKVTIFSVGLQGVTESNLDKIGPRIQQILEDVVEQGFEHGKIEGILHQMEIALKKRNANFGMTLFNAIASGWFHGVDPLEMLSWNKTIDDFRQRMASGKHFESLITKYLLKNTTSAQLQFTMRPLATFSTDLAAEENRHLTTLVSALSDTERQHIKQDGLQLLEDQNAPENTSCLPTLRVTDIPLTGRITEIKDRTLITDVNVLWHYSATGITYFRLLSNLQHLPSDLEAYVPLFADCFTNLGTIHESMEEIEDRIKLNTGGITVYPKVSTDPNSLSKHEASLLITASCIDRKSPAMFELIRKIVYETNFENTEKLRQLLKMHASSVISTVAESGHAFARSYAGSFLTSAGHLSELQSGMTQIRLMTKLAGQEDLSDVIFKLKRIRDLVFKKESVGCFVTTAPEYKPLVTEGLQSLLVDLDKSDARDTSTNEFTPSTPAKTFFPLPYSVNFVAMAICCVPYTHPDGAALQILASLLSNHYLHREIREQGGAYGGGATYSPASGVFAYYSYRDPNVLRTLQTMERAGSWAATRLWTPQELEEAKLSLFQGIDAPISLSSEGMLEFSDRITPQMRQKRREQLLQIDCAQVQEAAKSYIVMATRKSQTSLAVLGPDSDILKLSSGWKRMNWSIAPGSVADANEAKSDPSMVQQSNNNLVTDKFHQKIRNPRYSIDGELLTVELTASACSRLGRILGQPKSPSDQALRVALESGGCHGYQYVISLTSEVDDEEDIIFQKEGATLVVDQETLQLIDGSKIDYAVELIGSEFKVLDNPRALSKCGCDTSIEIDLGKQGSRATEMRVR